MLRNLTRAGFAVLLMLAAPDLVADDRAEAGEAAEIVACGGRNILAELERTDPSALAEINAQANAQVNPAGLFWRIEGPGGKVSHLFGTIHLADPRLARLPGPVGAALDGARVVAVELAEVGDDDDGGMVAEFMRNIGDLLLGPKGVLDDYLGPEEMEALGRAGREFGLPLSVARSLQPWLVASFLALPQCELMLKRAGAPALDSIIARRGRAAGARLIGLETVEEQIAAMNSVDLAYQIAYLRAAIELFGRIDDVHETMVQLYLDEQVAALVPLSFHLVSDPLIRTGYADFQEKIVDRRNRRMLARILPEFRRGNVFLAVGALHLPGKNGLVAQLRAAGFSVTRVVLGRRVGETGQDIGGGVRGVSRPSRQGLGDTVQ